jgi:CheY-specific phosphatase CheX
MTSMMVQAEGLFAQILENWGLMMVNRAPPEEFSFDPQEPCFLAEVDFHGVVEGTFSIVCQKEFAVALTHNLLASDEAIDKDQIEDSLRELSNVLSGNCLTTFFGDDTVFGLLTPKVAVKTLEEIQPLFNKPLVSLIGDDQPVVFTFSVYPK